MKETQIGWYWFGDEEEIVLKKDDQYFIKYKKDGALEEFAKEKLQYAMTTPWDKMRYEMNKLEDGRYEASYLSIIYDFISCRLIGIGDTQEEASLNLISNILDVFNGYDKDRVDNYMENCD